MQQEHTAMKVCTDACLFGAWVAEKLDDSNKEVLDIGTGTGLLSLMLAQAHPASNIDTVELDAAAAKQAKANFAASPFASILKLHYVDVQNYRPGKLYDLIISNPPFFENDLKSDHGGKNAAKHDTTLTLAQLVNSISTLLQPNGRVALLLPLHRMQNCEQQMKNAGFNIIHKAHVYQSSKHASPFRVMWIFKKDNLTNETEDIIIKDDQQEYTDRFTALLKPYYLKL